MRLFFLIAQVIVAGWTESAWACRCDLTQVNKFTKNPRAAQAAFLGKVVKIEAKKKGLGELVSFQIERSWAGTKGEAITIEHIGGTCSLDLKPNEKYLILSAAIPHHPISVCSTLAIPGEKADPYVKKLNAK